MEGQGSQGGYQADGQTAGSDLVDRNREGSPVEGATVALAFVTPTAPFNTHTHMQTNTHIR